MATKLSAFGSSLSNSRGFVQLARERLNAFIAAHIVMSVGPDYDSPFPLPRRKVIDQKWEGYDLRLIDTDALEDAAFEMHLDVPSRDAEGRTHPVLVSFAVSQQSCLYVVVAIQPWGWAGSKENAGLSLVTDSTVTEEFEKLANSLPLESPLLHWLPARGIPSTWDSEPRESARKVSKK